jgi:hypothetical protein
MIFFVEKVISKARESSPLNTVFSSQEEILAEKFASPIFVGFHKHYKCSICPKTSKTNYRMENHLKKHVRYINNESLESVHINVNFLNVLKHFVKKV